MSALIGVETGITTEIEMLADVRSGSSSTDLTAPNFDFRSSPESGLKSDIGPCPVRATSGHQPFLGSWSVNANRKTASRRSLRNPVRCF